MNTARDSTIRAAIAAKETQDTKIAQKVLAAHREAFQEKLPGQMEHCVRLLLERLQACLAKPEGCVLSDPITWPASADDILAIARSVESLWPIYEQITTRPGASKDV